MKQASGQASGNLPEPSGTAVKLELKRKLPDKLPETFRNLPDASESEEIDCLMGYLEKHHKDNSFKTFVVGVV